MDPTVINKNKSSDVKQTPFRYGWCKTDHKSGKEIRDHWPRSDFMFDPAYAPSVEKMLSRLGLPIPSEEQIFRGTAHDFLFLDSHGVVVRIGFTDHADLINPGILQPLGWLEDPDISLCSGGENEIRLSVSVYPGIELYEMFSRHKKRLDEKGLHLYAGILDKYLANTNQLTADMGNDENLGVIRIVDDKGKEKAVSIVLDIDNEANGTYCHDSRMAKRRFRDILEKKQGDMDISDALLHTLQTHFNDHAHTKIYLKTVMAHQPLRKLFWSAVDTPDISQTRITPQGMEGFWQACAKAVNRPQNLTFPVWHIEKNADGSQKFVRQETEGQIVLYRPWTRNPDDLAALPDNRPS